MSFRFIFPTLGKFPFVPIKHDLALIAFCKCLSESSVGMRIFYKASAFS